MAKTDKNGYYKYYKEECARLSKRVETLEAYKELMIMEFGGVVNILDGFAVPKELEIDGKSERLTTPARLMYLLKAYLINKPEAKVNEEEVLSVNEVYKN